MKKKFMSDILVRPNLTHHNSMIIYYILASL